jgi:hypothetical protein
MYKKVLKLLPRYELHLLGQPPYNRADNTEADLILSGGISLDTVIYPKIVKQV